MNTPWRTIIREKYVATGWRRTYRAHYVLGPAPRDLTTLSQLPPTSISTNPAKIPQPCWESPDKETRTWNGQFQPAIESIVTTPDGIKIPYRIEGSPDTSAPTILFSNSLLTDWTMWDLFLSTPFGKQLLQKYRVIRYNTRGRNDLPSTIEPITINTVTTDILTLLAALRVFKLHALVGVSLGGATTLNFSLRYPEKVDKFIACDLNIASTEANISAWKSRIAVARKSDGMRTLAQMTVDRWFASGSTESDSEQTKDSQNQDSSTNLEKIRIKKMVGGNSVSGFVEGVKALYHYDLRKEPGLKGCKVPGLLVVGELDGILPDALAKFAGDVGEGCDVKVIRGAGHLPMVQRPDEFVDAVKEFLG